MKILTICERGNSRSVALAWLLKDGLGMDAIAIGIKTAGDEAKDILFKWADKLILVDKDFESLVPDQYKDKLLIWDVGKDRFFRGFEPELLSRYKEFMSGEGWVIQRGDM